MEIAFAFDTSASMRPYIEQVKLDANAIVNAAIWGDDIGHAKVGWVTFGSPNSDWNGRSFADVSDNVPADALWSTKVDNMIGLASLAATSEPDGDTTNAYSGLSSALFPLLGPWDQGAASRKLVLFTDAPANDKVLASQVAAYAADLSLAWEQIGTGKNTDRVQVTKFQLTDANANSFDLQIYTVLYGNNASAADDLKDIAHDNRGEFFNADDWTPRELANNITGTDFDPLMNNNNPPSINHEYIDGAEYTESYFEDLSVRGLSYVGDAEGQAVISGEVRSVTPSEGLELTAEQLFVLEHAFSMSFPIAIPKWSYYVPYDSPNHTGFSFLDDGQSITVKLAFTAIDEQGLTSQDIVDVVIHGTDESDPAYDIIGDEAANILVGSKYGELIDGGEGDDVISGLLGHDWLAGGSGKDTFRDSAKGLNGDRITDLSAEDRIEVTGQHFGQAALTVEDTPAGQVLKVDVPDPDHSFKLKIEGGDHSGGEFLVGAGHGPEPSTSIFYVEHLPELREGVRVTDSQAEGIVQPGLLGGDGHTGLEVSLKADAKAQFQNTVGAYDIDENGVVSDVRVLFQNSHATSAPTAEIAPVEAGHQVGFFIVQDGFRFFNGGLPNDLKFIDAADGSQGTVHDSLVLQSASLGRLDSAVVFHSYSDELNPDGRAHVLSGADKAGDAFLIGFEDLLANRSDFDFQDVILRVSAINSDYAV